MNIRVSFLIEIVERSTGHSIFTPVEKVYDFDEQSNRLESDSVMEYYARCRYRTELRYQPKIWKELISKDWIIDCVLMSKTWEDGRPYVVS